MKEKIHFTDKITQKILVSVSNEENSTVNGSTKETSFLLKYQFIS